MGTTCGGPVAAVPVTLDTSGQQAVGSTSSYYYAAANSTSTPETTIPAQSAVAGISPHEGTGLSAEISATASPSNPTPSLPSGAVAARRSNNGTSAPATTGNGTSAPAPTGKVSVLSSASGIVVGLAKVGAGGLAARRNFQGSIAVASNKKESRPIVDTRREMQRKIQWCTELSDRYELGSEVMPSCHTGMQVLFAKQKLTGIEVVIKVRIKSQSFKDDEEREWRLSTEYMLNLPVCGNIARLHEVLEDVGCYYVVMERCPGQDLFESIHNHSKLNVDEIRDVLFQILTALAEMHELGLVHKDLKLENVMIERTPTSTTSSKIIWNSPSPEVSQETSPVNIKIVDFDTVEEHIPSTPKKAKDVLGTDQYIAQEAYSGMYSPASDIFAVGVIAYRLLVGRFPYDPKIFNDKPGDNWVGSPKMKEIRDKLCKFQVNYMHRVFQHEPQACDLVKSMLNMKELDRPSAKDALAHPWFARARSPPASPKIPKDNPFGFSATKQTLQSTSPGPSDSALPNQISDPKS